MHSLYQQHAAAAAATAVLTAVGGQELRVLALECGPDPGDAALVVSCWIPKDAVWSKSMKLLRQVNGSWVGLGTEILASDTDLAAALLPFGRGVARGGQCIEADVAKYAPEWPQPLISALGLWGLKGRGTVVFDGKYFLDNLTDLVEKGRGPVLFPGGASSLGLPTTTGVEAMSAALSPAGKPSSSSQGCEIGVASLFLGEAGKENECISYGSLLDASEAVSYGRVDLSQSQSVVGSRRTVILEEWPFGFMWAPRTEIHGAVIRELEPEGIAECAGCRVGDIIVSANGQEILDAPLWAVNKILSTARLELVVEQPMLPQSFYLRESTPDALRTLAGEEAESSAYDVIPALERLMKDSEGAQGLQAVQQVPKVFVGDAGSASRLHIDTELRVQFCHVLHGTKLFAVEYDSDLAVTIEDVDKVEMSCAPSRPLPEAQAAWLSGPGVSLAACRPGDLLCFWGGDRHGGINAMASGPCVALFHGYRRMRRRDRF